AAQLGRDPILQKCPWNEPAISASGGHQGLRVQQLSHRCKVLSLKKGIAAARKKFAIIIMAEVDVSDVRENPPVANLEDFREVIRINCRRFGPLPPTSQNNR